MAAVEFRWTVSTTGRYNFRIVSFGFLFICTKDEFACLREVDVKFVCMVAVDSQGRN